MSPNHNSDSDVAKNLKSSPYNKGMNTILYKLKKKNGDCWAQNRIFNILCLGLSLTKFSIFDLDVFFNQFPTKGHTFSVPFKVASDVLKKYCVKISLEIQL